MCSDPNLDAHRFMDIIEKAIREDKVKLYKSFKQWAEIVVKRVRPKDPFKKRPKARKDTEDSQALVKAIRSGASFDFREDMDAQDVSCELLSICFLSVLLMVGSCFISSNILVTGCW